MTDAPNNHPEIYFDDMRAFDDPDVEERAKAMGTFHSNAYALVPEGTMEYLARKIMGTDGTLHVVAQDGVVEVVVGKVTIGVVGYGTGLHRRLKEAMNSAVPPHLGRAEAEGNELKDIRYTNSVIDQERSRKLHLAAVRGRLRSRLRHHEDLGTRSSMSITLGDLAALLDALDRTEADTSAMHEHYVATQ